MENAKTLLNSVKSYYSLHQSTLSIDKIIDITKKCETKRVALVDQDVMVGALEFYHKSIEADVVPVFGLQFNCMMNSSKDSSISIIAYAKGDNGFVNLMKISSIINSNSEKSISIKSLIELKSDLIIVILPYSNVLVHDLLLLDQTDKNVLRVLQKIIVSFLNHFKNDLFVGIQGNYSRMEKIHNDDLKSLCKSINARTVAINNVACVNQRQSSVLEVLSKISSTKKEEENINFDNMYVHDMNTLGLYYNKEDIDLAFELLNMCNVEMKFKKATLPILNFTNGKDAKTLLTELCFNGLKKRLNGKENTVYSERLKYELKTIFSMGFETYFMILFDIVRFAKKSNIVVGPGRGSVVGSLVAYCLGITKIDPIKSDLLFERFLNPERISMPDIDLDFQDDRRNEIVDYLIQKHHKENTAKILTINIFGKNVLSAVGKVMNISTEMIEIFSKEWMKGQTVYDLMTKNYKIKNLISKNEKAKEYCYVCSVIEKLPSNFGTHPAGLVIANDKISNYAPLMTTDHGNTTQFTAEYLEELGLIKMDILSLKYLTTLKNMECEIRKTIPDFAIDNLDMNDESTFKLLQQVDVLGLFQLESSGMQDLIRDMKIKNFEDLVIAISLYRPGPMKNIPTYLNARRENNLPDYPKQLLDILGPTNGIIIYQEQVIRIAQVMAGFSLSKADVLRKAISKKDEQLLTSAKKEFVECSIKNGYSDNFTNEMFDYIYNFANYGFNKSHSVAYALIAYQLAYIKSHYPLIFYTESLNNSMGSKEKVKYITKEATNRGIQVSKINFNYSCDRYYILKNIIISPLQAKAGIGNSIADLLIKERNQNGIYNNEQDFINRMKAIELTSKKLGITTKQELTELLTK